MAKKQVNGSDADGYPEDELPKDQIVTDDEVAANPFETAGADPIPAAIEEKVWNGAIAALNGTTDELHAIQMRLVEIKPFLSGAIDKATGDVKGFLQALADHL